MKDNDKNYHYRYKARQVLGQYFIHTSLRDYFFLCKKQEEERKLHQNFTKIVDKIMNI